MRIVLYAEFRAVPSQADHVHALIHGLAESVRAEPGNIEFSVFVEKEDPHSYFVFEIYRDQAAFDAHLASPWTAAFNDRIAPLIEQPETQLTMLADG